MLFVGEPLICSVTGAAPTLKRTLLRSPGQFLAPEWSVESSAMADLAHPLTGNPLRLVRAHRRIRRAEGGQGLSFILPAFPRPACAALLGT